MVPVFALVLFGAGIAAYSNYEGYIRVPGLAEFTRASAQGDRPATIRLSPRIALPVDVAQPRHPGTPGNSFGHRNKFDQAQRTPKLDHPPNHGRESEADTPPDNKAVALAFLESKGLVRETSALVLRSEADARSKLVALRTRANEYNSAFSRLDAISTAVAQLADLEQAVINIDAEIAEFNFQMSRYPAICRGGIWYHGMNMLDDMAYEGARTARDADVRLRNTVLVPQRDTLRRQQPGYGLADARYAFTNRRDSALGALNEMRDAISISMKGYEAVANDVEVKKALAILGQVELGPSPEMLSDVREFGQFEKSIGQNPTFKLPKASTTKRTKREIANKPA